MAEKNGGPAFPITYWVGSQYGPHPSDQSDGMTLRDYFAAGIMASLVGAGENLGRATDAQLDMIFAEAARVVYRCADAMLAAREVKE